MSKDLSYPYDTDHDDGDVPDQTGVCNGFKEDRVVHFLAESEE